MTRAFVVPGQGSQAVGMGKPLAEAFAAARLVFEEVDAAIAIRGESATFAARPLGPRALPPREIAEQFESLATNQSTTQRAHRASA